MKEVRFMDGYQRAVLVNRYLETLLGSGRFIVVQLVQAALLVGLAYGVMMYAWVAGVEHGEIAVMAVVAASVLWVGCSSACGVLVDERVMFLRERATANLDVGAYLYSKMRGLCVVGVVSVLVYSGVFFNVVFDRVAPGWLMIALLAVMTCGVSLGLMVSAFSRSKKQAYLRGFGIVVGMLGLGMVEMLNVESGVLRVLARMVPVGWATVSLRTFTMSGEYAPEYLVAFGYLLPLGGFLLVFLAVAYVVLKRQGLEGLEG